MDFFEDFPEAVAVIPVRIVILEFPDIADPPDVVADAIVFLVGPAERFPADFLAEVDGFKHGTIRVPAAADVVDLGHTRLPEELPEGFDQVVAVDVIPDLLAAIAEDPIGFSGDRAFHQIGQKPVKLGARMGRAGQAASTKTGGLHAEVSTVFLDEHIRRHFTGPEKRMLGLIDGHGFVDSVHEIGVRLIDFPSFPGLDQRQAVRAIAIHFVGAGEDKHRLGTALPGRIKQVERADRINTEISVRFLGGPVVAGLSSGMDDDSDILPQFAEKRFHGLAVADVEGAMPVAGEGFLQLLAGRSGGGFRPEKIGAHVVIDSDHVESFRGEALAGFRSNKSGRTGDECDAHIGSYTYLVAC